MNVKLQETMEKKQKPIMSNNRVPLSADENRPKVGELLIFLTS